MTILSPSFSGRFQKTQGCIAKGPLFPTRRKVNTPDQGWGTFYCEGPFGYLVTSFKMINLTTSLLSLVNYLINSPLMQWKNQTNVSVGPYAARGILKPISLKSIIFKQCLWPRRDFCFVLFCNFASYPEADLDYQFHFPDSISVAQIILSTARIYLMQLPSICQCQRNVRITLPDEQMHYIHNLLPCGVEKQLILRNQYTYQGTVQNLLLPFAIQSINVSHYIDVISQVSGAQNVYQSMQWIHSIRAQENSRCLLVYISIPCLNFNQGTLLKQPVARLIIQSNRIPNCPKNKSTYLCKRPTLEISSLCCCFEKSKRNR